MVLESLSQERILVFDPSYLPKIGTKTPNVDKFWSGVLGKATKGLKIDALAIVDIKKQSTFHFEAIQIPNQETLKAKRQRN